MATAMRETSDGRQYSYASVCQSGEQRTLMRRVVASRNRRDAANRREFTESVRHMMRCYAVSYDGRVSTLSEYTDMPPITRKRRVNTARDDCHCRNRCLEAPDTVREGDLEPPWRRCLNTCCRRER